MSSDLDGRLGLNIPYEWWPASPLLKEIEASGFRWVQLPSPPHSVLADSRNCIAHAKAAGRSIGTTGLRSVLHAPTDLLAGTPSSDRVFAGVLSYAAECGSEQVVYHAMALVDEPCADNEARLEAEVRSLERLLPMAEGLGITIMVENLAPVFPGPQTISAIPMTLRRLVRHLNSPALRICLDVGHANVIAGLRRTALASLVEPVLDLVGLFHLHDNLGGRWRSEDDRPGLDPLRLDLHLPPGRGTLAWHEIVAGLSDHEAPLLLEIHPHHRPAPGELYEAALRVLEGERRVALA